MAWTDAKQGERCAAAVTLKDGTTAQCGCMANRGQFCHRHAKGDSLDSMNTEQLNAYHESVIGYRPQTDDPNMTDAELLALCLGVSSGPDIDDEWELIEAGAGDITGRASTDVWQWAVVLPGEDEGEIVAALEGLDVSYSLASGPWERTTFSGPLGDLLRVRRSICGV